MKRVLDNLGRVCIPIEFRRALNIEDGQEIEISLVDNQIIITNPNYKDEFEDWLEECVNEATDDKKERMKLILDTYRYFKKGEQKGE